MRTTLTSFLVVLSFGAFAQTKQTANNIKTAAPGYSGSLAGVEGSSLSMARADHAHPGAVINVMAPPYNASNSGTDATAAVAAAAAALPNGTGTLEFPCGTFKLNFTTTKAVSIRGCGSGNVNTGIAGTLFIAQDTSKPIFQWGNGAATTARGFSVRDIMILGDTAAANEDAIYLFAARDVVIDSVAISSPGRDGVRIQCNTFSSSGIHINNSAISGARNHAVHVESCAGSFTSDVTMDGDHINGYTAANSRSLFLDSSTMYITNTYFDTGSAAGTGYLEERATFSNPRIVQAGMTVDNPNAATTSLDVSSWLPKGSTLASAITGSGNFNGNVVYSDGTVTINTSTAGHFYQPRFVNAGAFGALCFPLDETDVATCGVSWSRINATGSNTEAMKLGVNAALRITGTVTFPLQFTGGAVWRNATSLGLRYRKDSNNPSGDSQGVPISPVQVAPTYGAGITIDTTLGTDFIITATNGTAFSFGNPANCGTASCAGGRLTLTIVNSSGGALGAVTFGANYRVACWSPPANGSSRTLTFETDGTGVWTQVSGATQDVSTSGTPANASGFTATGCGTGDGITAIGGAAGSGGTGANAYGGNFQGGSATGTGIPGPGINAVGGSNAATGTGAPGGNFQGANAGGTNMAAAQGVYSQGGNASGNAAGTTGGLGGSGYAGAGGTGGGTATGTGGTGGVGQSLVGGAGGAASGAGAGGDGGRGGVMVGGTGGTSASGTGGTGGNGLGTSGGQGSNNGGGGDGLVSAGGTGNGTGPNGDGVSASSGSGGTGTSRGYGIRIAQNNTIKAHSNKNPLAGDPSSLANGDEWISGTTTAMTSKARLNGVTQPYLTFGANGSAATQTKRGVAGCATAASAGATCTTTVTWTVAFPDANYTCACSGTVITSGIPAYGGVTAKAAASCIVQTVAVTAAAAQFTNIECIAVHD